MGFSMSQPKSKTTDWVNLLQQSLASNETRPVGAGWLTRTEIQKLWKIGENKTGKALAAFKKAGKVEIFTGRVTNQHGINVKSVWYRIKSRCL
jgi:hypothetical protein